MLYVNPIAARHAGALNTPGDSPARRKAVLQEFEQFFLYQVLKEMRKTVPQDGLFAKSSQGAYFQDMMDDCMAGQMAQSGQLGIADAMEAQLKQQDEAVRSPKGIAGGLPLQPQATPVPLHSKSRGIAPDLTRTEGLPVPPRGSEGLPLHGGAGSSARNNLPINHAGAAGPAHDPARRTP